MYPALGSIFTHFICASAIEDRFYMGEMQSRKCDCFPPTTAGEREEEFHTNKKTTKPTPGKPFQPIKNSQQSYFDSKFKSLFTTSVYFVTKKSVLNTKEREGWWLVSLSFTKTKEKETGERCSVHSPNAASMRNY